MAVVVSSGQTSIDLTETASAYELCEDILIIE